jgi:hypothetical protein
VIRFRHLSVVVAAASAIAIGVLVWRGMMRLMEPDDVYGSGLDWVTPGPAAGYS